MHIVKKFNRFELKYVLSYQEAVKLKKEILKYALFDPYSKDNGKYYLSSLYYDTSDYKFYWEKVDGIKYRRKLRIRWYETEDGLSDDSRVFLEIKQRIDRVTQKKRIPVRYKDALAFCEEEKPLECNDPEDVKVMEEMYSLLKLYDLKPTVITSYQRQAFVGTDYDIGLRITFDSHVTYRLRNLELGAGNYDGFMIPPNFVIMEIKVNEKMPFWIAEMVAKRGLQLIRVSKYCQGLKCALSY